LAPGFALTNTWDKAEGAWYWADSQIEPCHTCGDKEIRNSPEKGPIAEPYLGPDWSEESYANGQIDFRPDLSRPDCLGAFAATENVKHADGGLVPADASRPARIVVSLQSPYIMTQASGSADGAEQLEVSVDGGKTWIAADLKDFGKAVGGQVAALARLTFSKRLAQLRLQATVQNNPFALPYLSPGRNTVTVSVDDPQSLGDNKLVVTYAYRTGARRKTYEQLFVEDKEIARAHDAAWEPTPTVVQKTFTARDLPAKFTIDVPTPADLQPVFPRMLFVRREVVSPGQEPLPLPDGARPPQRGASDQLKTLPNPLLTGTQAPPKRPQRPTRTTLHTLPAGFFAEKSGAAPSDNTLKWPKAANEAVPALAFVIGGQLPELPATGDLAAARLVIPVVLSHPTAPTKIGVVALRAAPGKEGAFDFAGLGETLGTAIAPPLGDDAPSWSPPKEIVVDVTRYLRSLQLGQSPHRGFALRVIPDRNVDDGWTVRVHLPQTPEVRLEIDAFISDQNTP
ncbi:MAG: hypothetical protein KDA41_01060, partial [Planctomycetales bacterium]|nr:hypothetical protein [Planctomycetales bacterium]